ncbi:MAG: hypothetical protein WED07_09105 [Candidatus Freyarchaeum deiterrae]
MFDGVAFPCSCTALKNETEVKIDKCVEELRGEKNGGIIPFKFSWDVHLMGKKMRIRMDNFDRFFDKRMLYRGFTEVIGSLMPHIYNLAQENQKQGFNKFRSYTSLREFLSDFKTLSAAILLNNASNFHELEESTLKVERLESILGKEISNLKPDKRLGIIIKEWKRYFDQIMELFTKDQVSTIILEYYIDLNLPDYSSKLEEFKEILKEIRTYNIIPILSIKGQNVSDKIEKLPLKLALLDIQSMQLYELIIDLSREKGVTSFTLFDIVRYLRGGATNSLNDVTQKSLDLLVDYGLLEKKDNKYQVVT